MTESLSSQQARLQEDLRGLVSGDARCDELTLQLFSSDGSPYQEKPMAVVWPRSAQDVAATAQYAAEKGLSTHLRGSGTSGVGGAIGSGIVVDFSRYMRRVTEIGGDYVRVQPGAIRERVNGMMRQAEGRFFAPSSGHVPTGTIGSILAVDNVGPRWLRYGAPHESVLELKVVSASGEIWDLRPFAARRDFGDDRPEERAMFRKRFLNAALAEANAQSFSRDSSLFDAEFDAELTASVGSDDASFFGLDFSDGYGVRSFRSDVVREEFFRRAFGVDGRVVRDMVGARPWADVLRVIRNFEPHLDSEQAPTGPLRCGFALRDVVRDGFDPTRLFVGSEGALGIIVEAKLASFPISKSNCAAILFFDSLEQAARAVPTILTYSPTLCDLLDQRVVSLVRDWDERFESVFPQTTEAALVLEFDTLGSDDLRARVNDLFQRLRAENGALGGWTAFEPEARSLFRDLLRKSSCAILRMAPSFQPFPFWDDARVPVETIPDFLHDVQELFKREHIVYSVGGNVGFGQTSIHPILPYSDDEERRAFALSDKYEELVLSYGGEIGVAKGNGRVRTAVLPKRYPNLFPAFVQIKDALDPANQLNPDVVVSPEMRRLALIEPERRFVKNAPEPDDGFGDYLAPETDAVLRESALHSRSIERRAPYDLERLKRDEKIDWLNRPKRSQLEFQLAWNPPAIYAPIYQCSGCGHCRIRTAETRMCPAFRNNPDEQSSPRAKANLLRGVMDGKLELEALTRDSAQKIAERCLRCHCCQTECPAQVDVPRLTFRLTSANRAASGMGVAELFAMRANFALSVATLMSSTIRSALTRPSCRWALEKVLGIAQGRKLPLLERRSYLSVVRKNAERDENLSIDRLLDEENSVEETQTTEEPYLASSPAIKRPRKKVALFIDSFANYFDAQLVDVTLAILDRNGTSAFVPQRPQSSGAVAFALGDLDRAEDFATRNVALFSELARSGTEILTLEPSSAVCIKKEYPYFIDDQDAQVVYSNTTDVCSYLARLLRDDQFDRNGLSPIDDERSFAIGYHAPCRSIALSGVSLYAPTPAQTLLECVPNATVRRLEHGCCGFSGYTGFTKRRFSESLRIGGRLLLATRDPELDCCSSECSFCNMQFAQGSPKPVVHALKLLAVSYGLLSLEEARVRTI
ncbi:MAG: FAD-binding oxidoreductase [Thermoguttaceae bacterium]|nr:FAD-binding oxidoreductase [Thermoguttaceae bacterium]